MGLALNKEQAIISAIENQDVTEFRTVLRDLTPEEIRALCKSNVPSIDSQYTILHYATWQGMMKLHSNSYCL